MMMNIANEEKDTLTHALRALSIARFAAISFQFNVESLARKAVFHQLLAKNLKIDEINRYKCSEDGIHDTLVHDVQLS